MCYFNLVDFGSVAVILVHFSPQVPLRIKITVI